VSDNSRNTDVELVVARARSEEPTVRPPEGFSEFVADKLAHADIDVERIAAGDLLLVFAASRGDGRALGRLEEACFAPIGRIVGHLRLSAEQVDELTQRVRAKLLVSPPGAAPKILEYGGRAALRNWIGVVATREALAMVRKDSKPTAPDEVLMKLESPAVGPELGYLKEHYREAFAKAFHFALGELSPRARNVLRHHYVHGLSIDEIGSVYAIHRSSAARRIAKARDDLLMGTRRRLVVELGVGRSELESIMRLIESRIDVSLRGALDPAQHAEPDEGS
jgi:RNA polymerase sigma-70 factor (ECF subfamily)